MKVTVRNNDDKLAFMEYVQEIDIDSNYRAEFTKIRRKRSLSSNSYLWLIITIGCQETGNDKHDLYSYFLDRYPTTKEVEISDKIYLIPITSSAFNTQQMSIFIDNIRRELNMMGIPTPESDSEDCIKIFNYYHERGQI